MLSRFAAAVVAVNLCACVIASEPIEAPARVVVVDDAITDREIELIRKAADVWNAARAGVIVSVERGKERALDCGVIYVSQKQGAKCPDGQHATACTFADGCSGESLIPPLGALGSDGYTEIVAHELGHSFLGPYHDQDRTHLMHEEAPTLTITTEQAGAVRFRR